MRLIDAENIRIKPEFMHDVCGMAMIRVEDVVRMLNEQPTIQPEAHWIPVTERLPEVSGCYLVSVKNDHERRYSKTAWFEKGLWFARQDVIAWMPLPEPYKEEDNARA